MLQLRHVGGIHFDEDCDGFLRAVLQGKMIGDRDLILLIQHRMVTQDLHEGSELTAQFVIQNRAPGPELMGAGIDQRTVFRGAGKSGVPQGSA